VIQAVEPFVSSQDIPKGARWSNDIAKELADTNFGILCVTKDNFQQPWLLFEAGALSKALDKSFVVPLLFDLKPSDLENSPLLQFQAASFSKEEIKKLLDTINSVCGANSLGTHDLDETFDVWFPRLQASLDEIGRDETAEENAPIDTTNDKTDQILEEILDLTRTNQKLLRNPEDEASKTLDGIAQKVDSLLSKDYRIAEKRKPSIIFYSEVAKEFINQFEKSANNGFYLFQIVLSAFKDEFPWIYDSGMELMNTYKTSKVWKQREQAIREFDELVKYTKQAQVNYGGWFLHANFEILLELISYIQSVSLIWSKLDSQPSTHQTTLRRSFSPPKPSPNPSHNETA
jgi:ElaB/YqjD/DUF883 family membrane-anchored ribosome-binding protein